ncbi:NACHT domain-containing protein [Trichocoleus sp. DQ-U1]|uniref:NACHT domain-containing protein n=1 Tax=Trichocoleus sp. DQ-U1 TaxID=2933926 RepID=UPI003296872F
MQKLLILSSNPDRDLNLNREVSDLITAIQRLGNFEIRFGLEACSHQLPELLAEHSPQVVHFCGHGAGEKGLVFQDEDGRKQFVSTEILARIFKTFSTEINCTVLNACDSDCQAEAIVEYVNYVIGMNQPILDKAAYLFSIGFYKGLAAGKTIEQAYEMGCIAIQIWSETNSQSTQSRQYRKAEYIVEALQPEQYALPEHLKPVLRKKSMLLSSSINSTPLQGVSLPSALSEPPLDLAHDVIEQKVVPEETVANINLAQEALPFPTQPKLPPGFVAFVKDGIERKEYKDYVRDAYDNFGQFSASNAANLTKEQYEQRKVFLGKVKQFWIKGFLEPSLQNNLAMKLGRENHPNEKADVSQRIETLSVELDDSFEELRETRIYEEIGQGRTLLILGDPGSGKTVALLQLAQRLIERSERNLSLPMPVVFNLSSWAKDQKSIADWMIDELREKYQVSKSLSEPWITQQQLILLMDGLDEVREENRNGCVRALNDFIGLYPQTEVAVCSRVRDYEALTERLQISSALCLQPLSSEQIYQFLDGLGESLTNLKVLLRNNTELDQFAKNPLIINLMSVAYQGWLIEDLKLHLYSASEHRNQHVFNAYIDRRLEQKSTSEYSKNDVLHWLSWLANRMVQERQTIFLIEKMQPTWLQHSLSRMIYKLGTLMLSGILAGLISFLLSMLHFRFVFLLLYEAFAAYNDGEFLKEPISLNGLELIVLTGVFSSVIMTGLSKEISTLGQLSWSWRRAKKRLFSQLFTGAKFGMILAIGLGVVFAWRSRGFGDLFVGLLYGLIFFVPSLALLFGLGSGLGSSEVVKKTKPNQGIINSFRICFLAGLTPEFLSVLWVLSLGLNSDKLPPGQVVFSVNGQLLGLLAGGLILGLIAGLQYGGIACIQHFILRFVLHKKGKIPWNYAKLLDFASSRLLMKKIGNGYVFFHRMLLEHFDSMYQAKANSGNTHKN